MNKENVVNKSELIREIAKESGFTIKDSEVFVNTFINVVEDTVANGKKVQLIGFGIFEPRIRQAQAEREGRNPHTGEKITIPAQPEKKTVGFKAGKEFKAKVVNK